MSSVSYKNGNYFVNLNLENGTKIRYTKDDHMKPEFPESMDIKITSCCNIGCPMCHEDSKPDGKHGDIMNAKFIETLHPYTELAIGGGNPLSHPQIYDFLLKCKSLYLVPSITVHQNHFEENYEMIKSWSEDRLVYGIGVSVFTVTPNLLNLLKSLPNVVVHLVAGIVSEDTLMDLTNNNIKVLFLGYKQFRRGESCYKAFPLAINKRIKMLGEMLPRMIKENWFSTISFDNLAIKQLNPRSVMSEEEYDAFYMGDDGEYTMFVDLVENEFTVSSTKNTRWGLKDNINEMFNIVKNNRYVM